MDGSTGKNWIGIASAIILLAFGALTASQYYEKQAIANRLSIQDLEIARLGQLTDQLSNDLYRAEAQLVELNSTSEGLKAELDIKGRELDAARSEQTLLRSELVEANKRYSELNSSFNEARDEIFRFKRVERVSTYILGVRRGVGVAIPMAVETRAGLGVFIDTADVLLDESLQRSLKNAFYVGTSKGGKGLDGREVILRFPNLTDTITITGGSAGAAMTLGIIALSLGKELNSSVVITGAILSDGTIDQVEEIEDKAQAAKSVNASLMLVPEGQGTTVEGIRIIEVADIDDAMKYILN